MWKERPFEKIWRGTEKFNVKFYLGRKTTELDPTTKRVHDDQGDEYAYDKLLLATGGAPIRLPFGDEQIIYFRTLQDYQRLRALSDQGQRFLVIGAGFIGSEVAVTLNMQDKQVTMVFLENAIGVDDRQVIAEIVREIDAPINVLARHGSPTTPELAKLGVARVSFGPIPMRATMSLVGRIAEEIKQRETYSFAQGILTYCEANGYFERK